MNTKPMNNMHYLVISSSLSPMSKSRTMAKLAVNELRKLGQPVEFVDMQGLHLPLCDGDKSYSDPNVKLFSDKIRAARGIVIASPVYNYGLNAVIKNALELTGKAWTNKIVGFICAAGGQKSYMSVMPFANSLMLDYRCTIIPRFVFSTGEEIADNQVVKADIRNRILELLAILIRYGEALT